MAAIVHAVRDTPFTVETGSLGFAVTIFIILALLACTILVVRRHKYIGGELGGHRNIKLLTSAVLVIFWLLYILLCSLESYCHISGF